MSKRAAALERSRAQSSDASIEASTKNAEGRPHSTEQMTDERPRPSPDHRPSIFEEDGSEHLISTQSRVIEGPPRPAESGFPVHAGHSRRGCDWGEDYRIDYGQSSAASYPTPFRRLWSPIPFSGPKHYDGRVLEYARRSRPYDIIPSSEERREFYHDDRRDFDAHGRHYVDRHRYDEGRHGRVFQNYALPAPVDDRPPTVQAASSKGGTSPQPSSSGVLEIHATVPLPTNSRRPLCLDKTGTPVGKMASLFYGDIISFVKELDPTVGWGKQTADAKDRLFQRLLTDYEFYGESTTVSEKYVRKTAGSALINFRYAMNQLIDKGLDRPQDLLEQYWDALKSKRQSKESKEKSEHMATISRGRASRHTTKKAVAQAVLVQLARDLKREPYAAEMEAAVEKEWAQVQEASAQCRRLRCATKANTSATQATQDFSKRLELLEALFSQWEPELAFLKRMKCQQEKEVLLKRSTEEISGGNEQAPLFIDNALQTMKAVDKGTTFVGSDGSESTHTSSSSGEEDEDSEEEDETDSEQDGSDSSIGKITLIHPSAAAVVEPSGETVRPISVGQVLSCNTDVLLADCNAGSKSGMQEARSAVELDAQDKNVGSQHAREFSRKGNQDVLIQAEKNPPGRPAKRKKLGSSTAEEPLVLDDDKIPDEGRQTQVTRLSIRSNRKQAKPSQAKVTRKGRKKVK